MDLLSSRPFWPIRDGLPATFPRSVRNESCEVLVIGAGISGALIAWRLAQAGIDTIVVDQREVGHGSTAGNTGLLLYELDQPLYRLAAQMGTEFAVRVFRRCRTAVHTIAGLVRDARI